MDKSKKVMYNENKEYVPGTLFSQKWKNKNKDSMKYAGDSAKKSVDAGLKEASTFMKDADEGTNFEDVQSASIKWSLANDSNNYDLVKKATMELIGHLSKENKEPYLKYTETLQTHIDAKDEYDYKNKNYTTTQNIDTTPNEKVREAQQKLNELGYTDKFGEKLKEDGLLGGKTQYAYDTYNATLMDIWNNKVGRELASMSEFSHMDYEELFEYAKKKGYLITDASKAYHFYGVEDYIIDPKNWAVNVEWDLEQDYLTFYKGYGRDKEEITLRIGPKSYETPTKKTII